MSVITVRQALNDAMREEMERDESIFIIGCDVGLRGNPFGVTKGLMAQFGEKRVRDAPISEAGFTGLGIGAAVLTLSLTLRSGSANTICGTSLLICCILSKIR